MSMNVEVFFIEQITYAVVKHLEMKASFFDLI